MVTASNKRWLADNVHHAYKVLRLDGVKPIDALKTIQSDVQKETGRLYSMPTIKSYALRNPEKAKAYMTSENHKESGRRYRRKKLEMENPEYVEFLNSLRGEPIKPDNRYVRVLMAMRESPYPLKGSKLAKCVGKGSVTVELQTLSLHGFTKSETKKTKTITRKGVDYLKETGVI